MPGSPEHEQRMNTSLSVSGYQAAKRPGSVTTAAVIAFFAAALQILVALLNIVEAD
jgi:hypothetical protein